MHWACHCDFDASWDLKKKKKSHNVSILPSFQYFNALICNILIFGIIFDYDFQFSINLWPESVTNRSQNRPIRLYSNVWNLWASGGSAPWTSARGVAPGPHQGPYGGPLDPTPIYATPLSNFLAPPLQKRFRRPWIIVMIHRTASNTSTSWQLQDQPIIFHHFRVEFCPILDKMTIYSSLHLYSIKSSAKYLTVFHCRDRMAWTEVWLEKLKIFLFSLVSQ